MTRYLLCTRCDIPIAQFFPESEYNVTCPICGAGGDDLKPLYTIDKDDGQRNL